MGIKYAGHHSDEFGIVCKIKELPLLPETRREKEDIPGRDGVYVYETGGFEEKKIVIECAYTPDLDFATRRYLSREVAAWLSTPSGDLILDKEPDKKYKARIDDSVDPSFTPIYDKFDLVFHAYPIAFSIYEDMDSLTWDSAATLWRFMDTSWDSSELERVYTVTGETTIEIQNGGTYNVYPLIKITGTATSLTIGDDDGNTFTYINLSPGTTIFIDCHNKLVYSDTGVEKTNQRSNFSGKYINLKPGSNSLDISGTITNVSIEFIFEDAYI